jgi:hypothetical protein
MAKKKIQKIIVSSKIKIKNYLNNEKVTVVDDIAKHILKRKLVSVNFDEYMEKKINTKNMMHLIIIIIICMIGALRLLFGAFVTDPKIWVLIADPFYLIGDRVLINVAIIAFIVVSVKIRLICLSCESNTFQFLIFV